MALPKFTFSCLVFLFIALQTSRADVALPACLPLEDCLLECEHGLAFDANGCDICSCYNPCLNYDCGQLEVCEVRRVECFTTPCHPQPVCVPKPGSTEAPPPSAVGDSIDDCLLPPKKGLCSGKFPRWFFNVTSLSCQGFEYGGCAGNANNFQTEAECLARCLPTRCPSVSCAAPCQRQFDDRGCYTCICPGATCQDMTCGDNEECQLVTDQCPESTASCLPRPKCLLSPNVKTTFTPISPEDCTYIECELKRCDHGFKPDKYGCKTCSCYDPCETYVCPEDKVCVVRKPDCSPDTENCRDAPLRECVDPPTPPPVVMDRPSPAELLECCKAGAMAEVCHSLCTTNLTLQSDNIPKLLQCAGDLNTYLQCVGVRQRFTSCCAKRGVSDECAGFCEGDGQMDTSNLHLFSQCLMSDDMNSVFSCFQSGEPDNQGQKTTSRVKETFPSFPTPAEVPSLCMLTPEGGSCDSSFERWFYNASSHRCEPFVYSGCDGNGNNFGTEMSCVKACYRPNLSCPDVMCALGCQVVIGQDGCNECLCAAEPDDRTWVVPTYAPTVLPTFRGTAIPPLPGTQELPGTSPFKSDVPRPVGPSSRLPVQMHTQDFTSFPTRQPTTSVVTGCCANFGVSPQCMKFCGYDWTLTDDVLPLLLSCQPFLNIGLQCAKQDKTFTNCCQGSGVTGECLAACGKQNSFNDPYCLIEQHPAMLQCFQNGDPDPPCRPVRCDEDCPWGPQKDSLGCKTCKCVDPCLNKDCGPNAVCTYEEEPECSSDYCNIITTGACQEISTVPCPMLDCSKSCDYGYSKDIHGCQSCNCLDPCQNVTCEAGHVCEVMKAEMCSRSVCETKYSGVCAETCPPMECLSYCPYGYIKNDKGCETCQCYDPCEGVDCGSEFKCKPTTVEVSDTQKYPAIGECVKLNECSPVMCLMYCEFGFVQNEFGCPICQCFDPCENKTCSEGYKCVAFAAETVSDVEFPVRGICQRECPPVACNMFCEHGFLKDESGCDTCTCYEPCKNHPCGETSVCQPVKTNSTSPLEQQYRPECVECTGMACRIVCDYGTVMLTESCPLCECYDPCQGVNCSEGKECRAKPVDEGDGSLQLFKGECSSPCSERMCRMYCEWGFTKDDNGCEKCQCHEPCMDVKCDEGFVCRVEKSQSGSPLNRYGYKGVCQAVQCPKRICETPCRYGALKDERGCELCDCIEPCQWVQCPANSECRVVLQDVDGGEAHFVGNCTEAIECPTVMCANMECPYGLKRSKEGCETCECYDPCEDVRCETGFMCNVTLSTNCPEGKPCRPYAACIPPTKPCFVQRENDIRRFATNLDSIPELNCANSGDYKPVQCEGKRCRCAARNGLVQGGLADLSLQQALDKCLGRYITATMRINADFHLIRPGEGSQFKQDMSWQIASIFSANDHDVTVLEYKEGSIIVKFVIANLEESNRFEFTEFRLSQMVFGEEEITVLVNGYGAQAHVTSFEILGRVYDKTTPLPERVHHSGLSRTQFLLLVILIPILVPLVIAVIVVVACCLRKHRKGESPLLVPSARSSLSFESILEKGDHKIPIGFDNPSYAEAKVPPPTATKFTPTDVEA